MTGPVEQAMGDYLTALTLAHVVKIKRDQVLDRAAHGKLDYDADVVAKINRATVDTLIRLGASVAVRERVMDASLLRNGGMEWGAVPEEFCEAYRLLYEAGYGTMPSTKADSSIEVGRAHGKPRHDRTSTGQTTTTKAAAKGKGVGRSSVIKDERMVEAKKRVDRKLRTIRKEIRVALSGGDTAHTVVRCTGCHKIGDDDWRWCPRCGSAMTTQET